jgi:hypothetical protein
METKDNLRLNILSYSQSPGPRYCNQGEDSGEDFYHKTLNAKFYEAYKKQTKLVVDLDGPDGYASSFLDEAFGNLIYDFGIDLVKDFLEMKSDEEPEWKEMLYNYTFTEWDKRRKDRKEPKVTKEHDAWYRLVDTTIKKEIWTRSSSGK